MKEIGKKYWQLLWDVIKCTQDLNHQFISSENMGYEVLMTIEEVADYLRVKKRTIYEWLKTGKIPAIKTVGQWRFKKERIDAWLESHQS